MSFYISLDISVQGYTVWHTFEMPEVTRDPPEEAEIDEAKTTDNDVETPRQGVKPAKEIGGRDGPDPTRYGDWEKAGRCIDF